MVLKASTQNPFVDMLLLTSREDPIYNILYVENFVFFIESDAV